jgi:chromosome segregation ATPase
MLKNLLGNGSKDRELFEEMRIALQEMVEERNRCELLILNLRTSNERLQVLDAPIAKVKDDLDNATAHLADVERRFSALTRLADELPSMDERAEKLTESQQRVEAQLATSMNDARKIRDMFADLSHQVDSALELKDRMASFMDVEKPFEKLRGEAESLRDEMEHAHDSVNRLQSQSEKALESQHGAMAKLEALERRCDEMERMMQDQERRASIIDDSTARLDNYKRTVEDLKRDIGTLKSLGDAVVQKSATLETQHDAVERAVAQANQLDGAMRQIELGIRQQQEQERSLTTLQSQMSMLRSLHEQLVERSNEISRMQRGTEEEAREARQELGTLALEMRKVMERSEFENRGLDSIAQRVSDLQSTLSDYERRFASLNESSMAAAEIRSQTAGLHTQLQDVTAEISQLDRQVAKFQPMRREFEELQRNAKDLAQQFAQVEASRPAAEATVRDLDQLRSVQNNVKDALEQAQFAHAEIGRLRASQSDAENWMSGVEEIVVELKDQVAEINRVAPTIEIVQRQAQRLSDSLSDLDARRTLVDDLQRRLDQLRDTGGTLEERGRQLQTQMEVTEQRYANLAKRSEEAEQLTSAIAGLNAKVNDASRKTEQAAKAAAAVTAKVESVEALAEQTRALKPELEQRERAIKDASKSLEQASTLRKETVTATQQLEELSRRVTGALEAAEDRAKRLEDLSAELDGRVESLQSVEKRLNQFDDRLSKWGPMEQEIARSLEQITARQGTIESLQSDLNRMISMAEKTAREVREITSAMARSSRAGRCSPT